MACQDPFQERLKASVLEGPNQIYDMAMTNCDTRATSRDWRLMPYVVLAADRVSILLSDFLADSKPVYPWAYSYLIYVRYQGITVFDS